MSKRYLSVLACVAAACGGLASADEFAAVPGYKVGQDRAALVAIEAAVKGNDAAKLAGIEAKLLAVLEAPAATGDAKGFVCRMLRQIGTERSVPALAKLLVDEKLSHMARFALEGMAGEKAAAAIREAIGKTRGALRIGMISSLGERRDAASAALLAGVLKDTDAATVEAALRALGKIGTPEALAALEAAKTPEALAAVRADSILLVADAMTARGERKAAEAVYKRMLAPEQGERIRAAAARGLSLAGGLPAMIESLKAGDPAAVQAAGALGGTAPSETSRALAAALPEMKPAAQAAVIAALAACGEKAAGEAALKAAQGGDAAVRLAAVKALGAVGGPEAVGPLVGLTGQEGELGAAAAGSLRQISGEGVTAALAKAAQAGEAPARVRVIGVLGGRGDKAAVGPLIEMTRDADASVRIAACKALGELAAPEAMEALAARVLAADDAAERSQAGKALAAVGKGVVDEAARVAPITAAMAKSSPAARCELLAVLARVGGRPALAAVREQLSQPAPVHKAAVRALADWPDAAALESVAALAREEKDAANRTLALRGYIRLAGVSGQPASVAVKMLAEAMTLATGVEEKKAALAVLPKVACPEGLALAESAAGDPKVSAEAKLAAQKIRQKLPKAPARP